MRGRLFGVLLVLALVAGCSASASPTGTPSPSIPPPSSPLPVTPAPSESLAPTPNATAAVAPSTTPAGSPMPPAALPVRGATAPLLLAPATDEHVYVSIDDPDGVVVVRLDPSGAAAPGWPVRLPHATGCWFAGAAVDGSLRLVCDATDIAQPDLGGATVRAFALGTDGRLLPGWPAEIDEIVAARVIGTELAVVSDLAVGDTFALGRVGSKAHLARIARDGSISAGVRVPMIYRGGGERWSIGPDGIAYAPAWVATAEGQDPPFTTTELLAIDLDGAVDGWGVDLHGIGTALGFTSEGRIVATVGGWDEPPLRVVAFEAAGGSPVATSPTLDVPGPGSGLDCNAGHELLGAGGTTVLAGDVPRFYALDERLGVHAGWPYEPPRPLQQVGFATPGDVDCVTSAAAAALGPDGTLYVPLTRRSDAEGGEIVAVGRDGAVVDGWPVRLTRALAGFWQVAVGPDGTVFALAVEREGGGLSKTLLAIDPDSAVRWRTTLVEP